jgi:hypothetical protein
MTLYLQMDGVDDYVTIPNTFSYNRLVIDFMPVFKTGVIQYYWDSELQVRQHG